MYSAGVMCLGHDSESVWVSTVVLGTDPKASHSEALVSVTLLSVSCVCAVLG